MDELKSLFDSVEVGREYLLAFAWCGTQVHREEVYEVIAKTRHCDYTYSLFCRTDEGVGYYWIMPKWRTDMKERIVSATLAGCDYE